MSDNLPDDIEMSGDCEPVLVYRCGEVRHRSTPAAHTVSIPQRLLRKLPFFASRTIKGTSREPNGEPRAQRGAPPEGSDAQASPSREAFTARLGE